MVLLFLLAFVNLMVVIYWNILDKIKDNGKILLTSEIDWKILMAFFFPLNLVNKLLLAIQVLTN